MQSNHPYHIPHSRLSLDYIHLGCCYYPEHRSSKEEIIQDIERMAANNLSIVRLGEGAWWYWEPEENHFQYDLFDFTLDLCQKHNIKAFMGTPTYACPAWVSSNYPEVLRWDFHRTPMKHGSRRNMNYTSPQYYELSGRICQALAEHYKNHPQIIGWQIDNEFNCHMSVSYAPSDTLAFRAWLQKKYQVLDRLNEAWGTKFWSQVYNDWSQVDLPHPTATHLNPSQLLDESRFISDCVIQFASHQSSILRKANPNWLITHNSLFENVNGPDLLSTLDFFSLDQYPLFFKKWSEGALYRHIQSRSFSFPYGIMEHQSGPGGQMEYLHRTPRPNELRLWTWEAAAHGAQFINYFLWRTCPFGSEQHWHGLIDQDNRDTQRLAEVAKTAKELHVLEPDFLNSSIQKTFAVFECFENEVHDNRINTYTREGGDEFRQWLSSLAEMHHPVDIVWEESDWSEYRFLIAPHERILAESLSQKMRKYVENGGILILGARTGTYTPNVHVTESPLPGHALSLAGIELEEWTTLPQGESLNVLLEDGSQLCLTIFVESLRNLSAQTIGKWLTEDTLLSDRPALSRNRLGKGEVWYIGGYCPKETILSLIKYWEKTYELQPLVDASDQVEAIKRISRSTKKEWLFLLNHSSKKQLVKRAHGEEILTSQVPEEGIMELEPYGVAIFSMC